MSVRAKKVGDQAKALQLYKRLSTVLKGYGGGGSMEVSVFLLSDIALFLTQQARLERPKPKQAKK